MKGKKARPPFLKRIEKKRGGKEKKGPMPFFMKRGERKNFKQKGGKEPFHFEHQLRKGEEERERYSLVLIGPWVERDRSFKKKRKGGRGTNFPFGWPKGERGGGGDSHFLVSVLQGGENPKRGKEKGTTPSFLLPLNPQEEIRKKAREQFYPPP